MHDGEHTSPAFTSLGYGHGRRSANPTVGSGDHKRPSHNGHIQVFGLEVFRCRLVSLPEGPQKTRVSACASEFGHFKVLGIFFLKRRIHKTDKLQCCLFLHMLASAESGDVDQDTSAVNGTIVIVHKGQFVLPCVLHSDQTFDTPL